MWPCTKCPPMRPSAARARSRLTGLSRRNVFRFVRSSVSSRRSKVSGSRRCAVTVRQQPFTATLSPVRISFAIKGAAICNCVPRSLARIQSTLPTSSTRPVNIDQLLARQRQPANQEKYRQQDGKGKLCDEANKTRHLHFVLLGDCLDHEIGTVANVSRGSEQNSAMEMAVTSALPLARNSCTVAGSSMLRPVRPRALAKNISKLAHCRAPLTERR